MKITLFAKKRMTNPDENGKSKPFYTYLTTLVNKESGEPLPVQVKFRESCGAPDGTKCPCFIEVPRSAANLSYETYTNSDGEKLKAAKMWVSEWSYTNETYEDHSLDAFDAL